MSKDCTINDLLLARNGVSQSQRYIDALDPNSVKLHDLTTEDWMRFALRFSKKVNYFDTKTNKIKGNWNDFFVQESEIVAFAKKLEHLENQEDDAQTAENNIEPHLTLFAAFLKLTSYSQKRLNSLSKKHLDFYYKEVLKLNNKAPVEDKVHVLFDLAKNASEVKIDQYSSLYGKKDAIGIKRIYKTQEEIVVNKTAVASLRSIYLQDDGCLKNALVANSFNGARKDFPDGEKRWWPFGYPDGTPATVQGGGLYPYLPFAKTGFGLSSPVLLLKEGIRTITFTFEVSNFDENDLEDADLSKAVSVFFSGEKVWIEGVIQTEGDSASSVESGKLILVVVVDEGKDSIVNYDKEVLLEPYNTTDPVARIIVKDSETGYKFQELFSEAIVDLSTSASESGITIEVVVSETKDIIVENDSGALNASKPFFPFGAIPIKGSNFFIGLPEVLNKNWTSISIDFTWLDKPADFNGLYVAYREEFQEQVSKARYILTLDKDGNLGGDANLKRIITSISGDEFTADVKILEKGIWENYGNFTDHKLFDPATLRITRDADAESEINEDSASSDSETTSPLVAKQNEVKTKPTISEKFSAAVKNGFVRLVLKRSFLHEMFPRIFSIALSKKGESALVPNEPYTPQIESIRVGYSAIANTANKKIKLFHEHPFGISEESNALKNNSVLSIAEQEIKLMPSYTNSSLFIGLENAKNSQSVSLLVQTLEGSENPETTNDFEEGEKLAWSILCNNEWLSLDRDYIITNNTDNFLKTGIVKFAIPEEATQDNTKLPSGYFWLKVDNPRDYDTVSQLIDIKSQAVLAQFENNNNDLAHLKYGLPEGTISKMIERLANVKGVSQDFASFDGKPKESDIEYYRRVSERLRHKQRAITIWDYEHLVLQEFPDIYKVNCLNHTSLDSFLSPGDTTLVVIPNIINQNVYDLYKPRISKAKRNEIQDFINRLNTLHVTAKVINAVYEEVMVSLKVKFYKGKDENFYTTQLRKDIAKLLAPWAFEETSAIDFGITLHESMVINYIEKLEYVDYISDFKLKAETGTDENGEKEFSAVRKVQASSAKVILTSVKYTKHEVELINPKEGCAVATSE